MIGSFFKILFRTLLAVGAVFAVLTALRYFLDTRDDDYVQIYSDGDAEGDLY